VRAYAFLADGAVEPLSGFAWPTPKGSEPGAWVDAATAPGEALRGYPPAALPYWLDDELWTVELAGTLRERDHLLLADRARLVGQIDSWDESVAWELVGTCAERVAREAAATLREGGLAEAAQLAGYVSDVFFYARDAGVAGRAASVAAKMSAHALAGDPRDAKRLEDERAWQAAWLANRLGL
jgi:hypothetical protein